MALSRRQAYSKASDFLLLLAVAMSWYSVAAGWAGQLVCYPIYQDMSAFGPEAFHAYSHGYLSRWASGAWPVAVMCLTWALLVWVPVRNVPKGLVWCIVALCVAFAAGTPPAAIARATRLPRDSQANSTPGSYGGTLYGLQSSRSPESLHSLRCAGV